MSLWEDGRNLYRSSSPFAQAATGPTASPLDGPLVCVSFNVQWLSLVCGALTALVQPQTWGLTGSDDPSGVLGRATELLNLFGLAGACPVTQDGAEGVIIRDGDASSTVFVPFAPAFPTTPHVLVASSDRFLHAWFDEIGPTGMTIGLDASVAVNEDTPGVVAWRADFP